MSGKFHQPQLWVKKTVNNNNQQTPSSPVSSSSSTNATSPVSNSPQSIGTSSTNDQVSSPTQPNVQPTNTTLSPSSPTTPKITSTLKHNATPFTPQNFVPVAQQPGSTPQPVPPTHPPQHQEKHPKKNHPKKQHQKANNQANNQTNNNQGNNVGNNSSNNNNSNNNNEQHYGSLLKNKTKVIIRNIPYNFTEQDFIVKCVPKSFVSEQPKQPLQPAVVDSSSEPSTPVLPEIPHFIYDPKKITWSDFHSGHKTMTQVFPSIAYLNFTSVVLLHQFKNEFYEELRSKQSVALSVQITDDDTDENPIPTFSTANTSIWRETPMIVEYCPLQMVPKPKKKDPRDGTIFKDEHYLKFLEQLKQPKDLTLQPLSLDNSSTASSLALDCGESSDGSTSSKKLGTNIPLALGGVGASSSYTKKTDEPIISPLLKELLEKKNKKGNQGADPTKPKGNNPKKSGKPQYKRKY